MSLSSVLFSLWVLFLLVVTVPPLWLLVTMTRGHRTHRLVQRWSHGILRLSGCRPQVAGLHHLTPGAGVVMVANHASFLDSVVLLATIPGDYRFVVNHQAATRPVLGAIIRKSGHLVVDRRSAASRSACARDMIASLESGRSLMLFPEGTRSPAQLLPFKLGAFRAAARTGRPVVPIAISGTRHLLPRRFTVLSPAAISVRVLAPIVEEVRGVAGAARLRDTAHAAMGRALIDS